MKKLLIGVFALLMLLPSLAFADTAVYGTWDRNPSGSSVLLPNGSAAAPALSFTNDTDTGIYYSATQINAAVGGSGVWSVNANGTVTATAFIAATTTKTADYSVASTDFGKTIIVNSSDSKTMALPSVGSSDVGAWVRVIKLGSGQVTIDAADSDLIDDSGAGDTIYCDDAGLASITLMLVSETQWAIVAAIGTWTTTD